MRQTIGHFLLRRLEEANIRHIFGIPGDFNLELLQQVEDRGAPAWIGNCNELNAAYAADGYARLNGLGAVIVTHGVGALSLVNGIAGSYSEHVPVVCICGTVPLKSARWGSMMHHTLADGGRDNFYRIFTEITAAQAKLTPHNVVEEVDRLLTVAWRERLPVYMELPSDIANIVIAVPAKPLELTQQASDCERIQLATRAILDRIRASRSPAFLLDMDADRFRVRELVAEFAEKMRIPVAVLNSGRSAFSEQSPLFAGVYAGKYSKPAVRELVEGSDCLILIGFRRIDITSGFFSDAIPATAIHLNGFSVNLGEEELQGVVLDELLDRLVKHAPVAAPLPRKASDPVVALPDRSDSPLEQKTFWACIQHFLRDGDLLLVENGTPTAGVGSLRLPAGVTNIAQAVWASIGYTLPALLGTLIAAPERRQILFIGDGAFQMTAQELSTILRHNLKAWIFLLNNDGYVIERAILGKNARYNDIAAWKYTEIAQALAGGSATPETHTVSNVAELRDVLESPHSGMVFVEVKLGRFDIPPSMVQSGRAIAEIDYTLKTPR